MRCVLRTIRNDAHPRTFRTLADLDYRDTPRLNCRHAPPLECSVHCIRCHELPVSESLKYPTPYVSNFFGRVLKRVPPP